LLLNQEGDKEEVDYKIGLPNGHVTKCSTLYRNVSIMIRERRLLGDLIQFDLSEFNVILGMNWLTTHRARIDYKEPKVILRDLMGRNVYFYGKRAKKENRLILAMKACKMLRKGCVSY